MEKVSMMNRDSRKSRQKNG